MRDFLQVAIYMVFLIGMLVFLVLLPLLNAVLDFLSLGISRGLLSHALRGNPGLGRIGGHIFLDVVLATIFLFLLAAVLPFVLEGLNQIFGWVVVNWREYLAKASSDPLGEGLVVTGMLVTTLIPTFLHLCVMVGILICSLVPRRIWVDLQGSLKRNISGKDVPAWDRWREYFVIVSVVLGSIASVLGIFYGLYCLLEWAHVPLGQWLKDWALYCGGLLG